MLVESALEGLGLTGAPSQQEIRRAYLRKVKEHPPERDREGFERVREAFELLKSGLGEVVLRGLTPSAVVESRHEEPTASGGELKAEPNAEPEGEPGMASPVALVPVMASPADAFQPQLDRLREAMGEDDPVAGAGVMIELYSRPPAETAPVPTPLLCFQTFMALMARNRFDVGRDLLTAFEKHAALNGLESGMSPDVGARWTLAREVAALSSHEESMTRAIAQSLNGGHLYTAGYAAQDAYERGVELERIMRRHAPTIWASLTPYLKTTSAEAKRALGWRMPYWPIGIALISLLRFWQVFSDTSHDLDILSPRTEQRATIAPPPREDLTPSPSSRLTFRERAQLETDSQWKPIAELAERGDCEGVRDHWPAYRKVSTPDVVNAPTAHARQKLILEHCSKLTELFDEEPR